MKYRNIFVTIAAEPWQEVVDFYRQLLNIDPSPCWMDRYAEFRLGIFKPSQAYTQEFQSISPGSLSLCLDVANLDEAIATVQDLGGTINPNIIEASHGRECYGYDPIRNRLILHES